MNYLNKIILVVLIALSQFVVSAQIVTLSSSSNLNYSSSNNSVVAINIGNVSKDQLIKFDFVNNTGYTAIFNSLNVSEEFPLERLNSLSSSNSVVFKALEDFTNTQSTVLTTFQINYIKSSNICPVNSQNINVSVVDNELDLNSSPTSMSSLSFNNGISFSASNSIRPSASPFQNSNGSIDNIDGKSIVQKISVTRSGLDQNVSNLKLIYNWVNEDLEVSKVVIPASTIFNTSNSQDNFTDQTLVLNMDYTIDNLSNKLEINLESNAGRYLIYYKLKDISTTEITTKLISNYQISFNKTDCGIDEVISEISNLSDFNYTISGTEEERMFALNHPVIDKYTSSTCISSCANVTSHIIEIDNIENVNSLNGSFDLLESDFYQFELTVPDFATITELEFFNNGNDDIVYRAGSYSIGGVVNSISNIVSSSTSTVVSGLTNAKVITISLPNLASTNFLKLRVNTMLDGSLPTNFASDYLSYKLITSDDIVRYEDGLNLPITCVPRYVGSNATFVVEGDNPNLIVNAQREHVVISNIYDANRVNLFDDTKVIRFPVGTEIKGGAEGVEYVFSNSNIDINADFRSYNDFLTSYPDAIIDYEINSTAQDVLSFKNLRISVDDCSLPTRYLMLRYTLIINKEAFAGQNRLRIPALGIEGGSTTIPRLFINSPFGAVDTDISLVCDGFELQDNLVIQRGSENVFRYTATNESNVAATEFNLIVNVPKNGSSYKDLLNENEVLTNEGVLQNLEYIGDNTNFEVLYSKEEIPCLDFNDNTCNSTWNTINPGLSETSAIRLSLISGSIPPFTSVDFDFDLNINGSLDNEIDLQVVSSLIASGTEPINSETIRVRLNDFSSCTIPPPPPCERCIQSFAPKPGHRYVVSAWVKEADFEGQSTFLNANIGISYTENARLEETEILRPSGQIIDGWQRIEKMIEIPADAEQIFVTLRNNSDGATNEEVDVYFDDIRFHPFNSNMKSFVYDPSTLRLWAELDERNYATYYEYDEEGALVRVKKETERGVKTIQESRNSIRKE